MPKKKITVVDIKDDETADIVDSNEVTVLEPITEEKNIEIPIDDKPIVEDKPIVDDKPIVEEDKPIVEDKPVEDTILRTSELVKCPKCNKLVTSKTLKYSHKKTCGVEDKPKPISKPIKTVTVIPDIEEVPKETKASQSQPKLVRTISIPPKEQQPTPEMMRTYRNQMRTEQLKMRSDRMSSLFTNSI